MNRSVLPVPAPSNPKNRVSEKFCPARRAKLPGVAMAVVWACKCMGPALAADERSPISFEALYTGEVWSNTRGGIEKGTRYLHNVDMIVEADLSFAGLNDTTLFLYGLHTNAPEFSPELAGDAQVVSNIDSGEVFRRRRPFAQSRTDRPQCGFRR